MDKNKTKEIRNLLCVLLVSVAAGFLFFLGLLYFYGPTGEYLIDNVMLSPESMRQLSYSEGEKNSTKQQFRFTFDHIEFVLWDNSLQIWKQANISEKLYQELYSAIRSGSENIEPSHQIIDFFYLQKPLSINIHVRPENSLDDAQSKIFQTIQFAGQGDYFRVELIGATSGQQWAYFYRSGIYQEISKLLLKNASSIAVN